MKNTPITIKLNKDQQAVLQHLAEFSGMSSSEQLVTFVICSVLDGARRPGAWERSLLNQMGIEANNDTYCATAADLLEHYKTV